MQAKAILKLVSGALQDLEPDVEKRWAWDSEPERVGLLDFLNQALLALASLRPDAFSVTETIRLEPGMRQSLPSSRRHSCCRKAVTLIELLRNMGQDGNCPGPAIISVNPDILLAWACSKACAPVIENFAYDRLTNPVFYLVYPGVPENTPVYVEATFQVEPCLVSSPEQELCLSDLYAPALMHHILASIFAGDSEASQMQKASWHMGMFNNILGVKLQIDRGWPKAKSSETGAWA